ncbi:hypothetical protein DIPPA_09782 [Diplonema papillatum]|nr:hypothetical protein DIPPA_09782 [Diplonema papillatum]
MTLGNIERFSCTNAANALAMPSMVYQGEQRPMYSTPAGDERFMQYPQAPPMAKDANTRPMALPMWQPMSHEPVHLPQPCGHVSHAAVERVPCSYTAGSCVAPPLLPPAVPAAAAIPPAVNIPVGGSFISSPPTSCYSTEAHGPPSFRQHSSQMVSPTQSPPRNVGHTSASAATASESESSFSGESPAQPMAPAADAPTPQALTEYSKRRCCSHNSWDNVRVTKGLMTLRCRVCQKQWRVRVDLVWNQLKCETFNSENSCTAESCPLLHLHYRKQSLEDRFKSHGATVLDHVKSGRITKDVMSKVVKLETTDDVKTASNGSRCSTTSGQLDTKGNSNTNRAEGRSLQSSPSTDCASSTSSLDSSKATLCPMMSMNMTLAPVLPDPSTGSNSLSSTYATQPPLESSAYHMDFPHTSPPLAGQPMSSPPAVGIPPQTPSPTSDQATPAPTSYSHDPYRI